MYVKKTLGFEKMNLSSICILKFLFSFQTIAIDTESSVRMYIIDMTCGGV